MFVQTGPYMQMSLTVFHAIFKDTSDATLYTKSGMTTFMVNVNVANKLFPKRFHRFYRTENFCKGNMALKHYN